MGFVKKIAHSYITTNVIRKSGQSCATDARGVYFFKIISPKPIISYRSITFISKPFYLQYLILKRFQCECPFAMTNAIRMALYRVENENSCNY